MKDLVLRGPSPHLKSLCPRLPCFVGGKRVAKSTFLSSVDLCIIFFFFYISGEIVHNVAWWMRSEWPRGPRARSSTWVEYKLAPSRVQKILLVTLFILLSFLCSFPPAVLSLSLSLCSGRSSFSIGWSCPRMRIIVLRRASSLSSRTRFFSLLSPRPVTIRNIQIWNYRLQFELSKRVLSFLFWQFCCLWPSNVSITVCNFNFQIIPSSFLFLQICE